MGPPTGQPSDDRTLSHAPSVDDAPPPRAAGMTYAPGSRLGRYIIRQTLGEGGFGVVYQAEQTEPVRRMVALKVIKPGMDSRAVIARFEAERQALAVMDHPCVAKVFDGGTSDEGRPYFVMEFVRGVPLTTHCDQQRLSIRERLDLFIRVCEAVQHAHSKGVIHRDLKPSNILVEYEDGTSTPKVIDFGIAKALSQRLTDASIFTERGALLGTPEYMSPEQAGTSAQDIDTRSDVYSLGVILYELLTGARPFDAKTLREAGLLEIQRIIREVEPPKPSTRLGSIISSSSDPSTATRIAQARQTELRSLAGTLRRDLDWVVMKCLEKNRERRYDTANALAMELRRFLNNEPVLAGPPSAAYRISKFVRRNRAGVIAASVVLGTLLLGFAGTAYGLVEAKRQEGLARSRAEQVEQVALFQSDMLGQFDPTAAGEQLANDLSDRFHEALISDGVSPDEARERVENFTAMFGRVNATDAAAAFIDRTLLRPAVKLIDDRFTDQPLVSASLWQSLANVYSAVGLYDEALPLQERSLDLRRTLLGDSAVDTLVSLNRMALLRHDLGHLDIAEQLYTEAIKLSSQTYGALHPDTLTEHSNYGVLLEQRGRFDEARSRFEMVLLERRKALGADHEDTITSLHNLGFVLEAQGDLVAAERLLREALEASRRVLGNDDPETLAAIGNLGPLLLKLGRHDEAESLFREAFEGSERIRGTGHPDTILAMNNLGYFMSRRHRVDEAEALYMRAYDLSRDHLPASHHLRVICAVNVAAIAKDRGRLEEAEQRYRDVLALSRDVFGAIDPNTVLCLGNLGGVLQAMSKWDDAEACFRDALAAARQSLGPTAPATATAVNNLADVLLDQRRYAEVLELLTSEEANVRASTTSGWPLQLAALRAALGRARVELGFDGPGFVEAEQRLRFAYEVFAAANEKDHPDAVESVQTLIDLYTAWHVAEPGKGYDAKAAEWQAKLDAAAEGSGSEPDQDNGPDAGPDGP